MQCEPEKLDFFADLPIELCAHTFSFLPVNELCKLELVSKQIRSIATLPIMWKPLTGRTKQEFFTQRSQLEIFLNRETNYKFQLVTDDPENNQAYKRLIEDLLFLCGGAFIKSFHNKRILLSQEQGHYNAPPYLLERCIIFCMSDEKKLDSLLKEIFENQERPPNVIIVVNPVNETFAYDNVTYRFNLDDKITREDFFENLVNFLEDKARELNINLPIPVSENLPRKRRICSIC